MAIIKFTKSGLFLSCEVKHFQDFDSLATKLILSDFSGHLTRIAQSSTREESSHLKIETDEELTTIVFCSEIRGFDHDKDGPSEMQICGDQLCWISEESNSIAILNVNEELE